MKNFALRKHMFVHFLLYTFNLEYKDGLEYCGVIFNMDNICALDKFL